MSDIREKGKPVGDPDFWKGRIEEAFRACDLRYSVFRSPESEWRKVVEHHKHIINDLIPLETEGNPTRVLDAGCGYGRASEWIPESVQYTGVDLSPDFIHFAGELYPDRTFQVGDLTSLPFENNTFDWSFCVSVMIMVVQNLGWSKWEAIQNELLRVSKNVLCLEYGTTDTDTESDTYYLVRSNG